MTICAASRLPFSSRLERRISSANATKCFLLICLFPFDGFRLLNLRFRVKNYLQLDLNIDIEMINNRNNKDGIKNRLATQKVYDSSADVLKCFHAFNILDLRV